MIYLRVMRIMLFIFDQKLQAKMRGIIDETEFYKQANIYKINAIY